MLWTIAHMSFYTLRQVKVLSHFFFHTFFFLFILLFPKWALITLSLQTKKTRVALLASDARCGVGKKPRWMCFLLFDVRHRFLWKLKQVKSSRILSKLSSDHYRLSLFHCIDVITLSQRPYKLLILLLLAILNIFSPPIARISKLMRASSAKSLIQYSIFVVRCQRAMDRQWKKQSANSSAIQCINIICENIWIKCL